MRRCLSQARGGGRGAGALTVVALVHWTAHGLTRGVTRSAAWPSRPRLGPAGQGLARCARGVLEMLRPLRVSVVRVFVCAIAVADTSAASPHRAHGGLGGHLVEQLALLVPEADVHDADARRRQRLRTRRIHTPPPQRRRRRVRGWSACAHPPARRGATRGRPKRVLTWPGLGRLRVAQRPTASSRDHEKISFHGPPQRPTAPSRASAASTAPAPARRVRPRHSVTYRTVRRVCAQPARHARTDRPGPRPRGTQCAPRASTARP